MAATPIFIPVYHHSGGKTTEQDAKILLGIFIFINLVWAVSWIITLIKWYIKNRDTHTSFKRSIISLRSDFLVDVIDLFMYVLWGIFILGLGGVLTSKLIF